VVSAPALMGHACSTKRSRRTGRPPVAAYVAFDAPDMQLLEQYERTTGRDFPRDRSGGVAHGDGMVAGRRPKDSGRPRGRSSRGRPVVALAKPCHSSK
jgi:hypothetical protein